MVNSVIVFGENRSNCGVLRDHIGEVIGLRIDECDYHYLGQACDMNGRIVEAFPSILPACVEKLPQIWRDLETFTGQQREEFNRVILVCSRAGIDPRRALYEIVYETPHGKDRIIVEMVKTEERRKEPVERAWDDVTQLSKVAEGKLQSAAALAAKTQTKASQGAYFRAGLPGFSEMSKDELYLFNLLTEDHPTREGWCRTYAQIGSELGISHMSVKRRKNKFESKFPEAKDYISQKRSRNDSKHDLHAEQAFLGRSSKK